MITTMNLRFVSIGTTLKYDKDNVGTVLAMGYLGSTPWHLPDCRPTIYQSGSFISAIVRGTKVPGTFVWSVGIRMPGKNRRHQPGRPWANLVYLIQLIPCQQAWEQGARAAKPNS